MIETFAQLTKSDSGVMNRHYTNFAADEQSTNHLEPIEWLEDRI